VFQFPFLIFVICRTESIAFLLSLIVKHYDIIIVEDLHILEDTLFSFLKGTFCKLLDLSVNYGNSSTLFLCFLTINKKDSHGIFFHEPYRFGKPIISKQQMSDGLSSLQSSALEKKEELGAVEDSEGGPAFFTNYSVYHKVKEELLPILFQPTNPFLTPPG
jgi:hypothetical protein